jgi:hypothetical protein
MFFFYKVRGHKGGTGSAQRGDDWHWWEGDGGERNKRVNMVQTMYTHVCKCKNDASFENCFWTWGSGGEKWRE